jgi:5'-3' exonuclease
VDGDYLLKRSFTTKTNYYTPQFGSIDALFNFMLTIRMLCTKTKCNKIVVVWDGENGGKLRYNLYKGYKSNRKNKEWYNKIQLTESQIKYEEDKEKSLLKQKVRIQNYLNNLFVRQISNLDFIEGDDIIAYYTKEYHLKEHIIIFTNDRDICQMVEYDGVNVYLGNIKESYINKSNYFMYFKHDHRNIRILKTFCGCSGDDISGVKGLGEKTLLEHFPKVIKEQVNISYILNEARIISEQRVKEKKKPLQVIENILNGISGNKILEGNELYNINYQIVDLINPMVTKEAKHIIKEESELPIDIENLGSKNLLRYMNDDGFLGIWNGGITTF